MSARSWIVALALTCTAISCADDAPDTGDEPAVETSVAPTGDATKPAESPEEPADEPEAAQIDILGAASPFQASGSGAEAIEVDVSGRECVPSEPLFGTCRAATGAGGAFVVTAEGAVDSPGEWNVVVRCGLQPAVPGASAMGAFTPVMADLGLAPYGEAAGVTLLGADGAEAAIVYQPSGAACPVVWALGEVDPTSLFTGGTDALNGEEGPLRFRDATGAEVCAVADGRGGISVGVPQGADCQT